MFDELEEVNETIFALRALIANDSYAITFQTMGQYRTALLKEIDRIIKGEHHGNRNNSKDIRTTDTQVKRG